MAGKLKHTQESEEIVEVLSFDKKSDYTAIILKDDPFKKVYVEHVHFAKKLVDDKKADYAKGVEIADIEFSTKAI